LCLITGALVLAACGSSSPSTSSTTSSSIPAAQLAKGGSASWAEPPQGAPTWIFPVAAGDEFTVPNLSDFQDLMFRPLYWFGTGDQPTLNTSESLAAVPVYNGTKVVVNLKTNLLWSNGEAVDAKDVVFWMNMLKTVASGGDWGAFAPGYFPENVSNVVATGKFQVTFTLTSTYSPTWFTYNELSQITPLPMAWDITKTGGAANSGGCADAAYASIKTSSSATQSIVPSGAGATACFAVYNYLANAKTGQAADPASYASNPLWQTVDGPWHLSSFDPTTGNITFLPNAKYQGPQKPYLTSFKEVGYTSDTAEYSALESGSGPDVGYIPPQDIPVNRGSPLTAGANSSPLSGTYNLALAYLFQINYFPLNLKNPTVGPIFSQQYARAALQSLIPQSTIIATLDSGYGVPTVGPVPTIPNTYASALEKAGGAYPYSPTVAKSLLTSNGWNVVPNGTSTCVKPGIAKGECGAGITKGEPFAFTLLWATGSTTFKDQVGDYAASWKQAGINVTLKGEQFSDVVGAAGYPCIAVAPTQVAATCAGWEAANWGGGWVFSPDYLPTGEEIFDGTPGCSNGTELAGSNASSYCDATNHANITATTKSSAPSAMDTYEDYLTKQLPVLWQPLTPGLGEINKYLYGVLPFNVFGTLNPEYWAWQKGHVSNS
jgi:peptide/nickel transport system substrate-binding protein